MLRIAIIELALFATPFVVWTIYAGFTRGRRATATMDGAPMPWLIVAGVALVIVGLGFFATFSGDPVGTGKYVPPVYEDGRIVPGHIEPDTNR